MRLYIDPGTGSMLFAILIGIISAVMYLFKSWLVKLRFILHGGIGSSPTQASSDLSFFLTTSGTGMFSVRFAASLTAAVSM